MGARGRENEEGRVARLNKSRVHPQRASLKILNHQSPKQIKASRALGCSDGDENFGVGSNSFNDVEHNS